MIRSGKNLLALCISSVLMMGHADALQIVHDSCNAVPSAQYLAQLFTVDMEDLSSKPTGLNFVTFPVTTTTMSPGTLPAGTRIKQPDWLVQPVFLIGSDPQSRTWLTQHLPALQAANALGIVVSINSYADFRAMQNAAPDVSLAPASADGLACGLGIAVYPVLVHTDGEVTQ
jgi:integrating conjugative element protein (TIGR03765 family)